jgi:Aminotransferase class I and II
MLREYLQCITYYYCCHYYFRHYCCHCYYLLTLVVLSILLLPLLLPLTGAVATKPQLEALVAHAKKQGSIVVFDAAYAPFIRSPGVPQSIFEIEGARSCCIEVGMSLSNTNSDSPS